MSRWKPDARERLAVAALDLFTEQGYDQTTVAQIAERAGLTRSTFFRHYGDKHEILTAGQEMLSTLLAEGIAAAPASASPLEAVAEGLDRASGAMTKFNRDLGPRLLAATEANEELRSRSAMKSVVMATAISDALVARGVPVSTARLAAELGVLAFGAGYRAWSDPSRDAAPGELTPHTRAALAELKQVAATLR